MKSKKNNKFILDWGKTGSLLLGFVIGQVLVGIVGAYMIFYLHMNYETSPFFMLFAYVVTMVFPIIAFDYISLKPNGVRFNPSFRSSPFIAYLFAFPMMFGMMLISEYLVSMLPTKGFIFGDLYKKFSDQMNSIATDNTTLFFMTVFFAPLLEELLFRGIILKGLLNRGMKPYIAIIISAFIFGAIHFYPWQFLGAFLMGLVLGLVYWKTKSLLLPVLLHGFNNLIASLSMIYYQKDDSFGSMFNIPEVYFFIIGIIMFGVFFYLFLEKYRIVHLDENFN